MKAPHGLDRIYRERGKDQRVTAMLERYLGVPLVQLSSHMKAQRAIRVAAGRATATDRMIERAEQRVRRRRAREAKP